LDEALESPESFIRVLRKSEYHPQLRSNDFAPQKLFTPKD